MFKVSKSLYFAKELCVHPGAYLYYASILQVYLFTVLFVWNLMFSQRRFELCGSFLAI